MFETRDSLNMYLAHDVREEPVIIHHVLGVFLCMMLVFVFMLLRIRNCIWMTSYADFLTLHWRAYLYFSCVVLVQVSRDIKTDEREDRERIQKENKRRRDKDKEEER